jgi:hypothetical protein
MYIRYLLCFFSSFPDLELFVANPEADFSDLTLVQDLPLNHRERGRKTKEKGDKIFMGLGDKIEDT